MTPCQTQQASTEYVYVRFQGKTELALAARFGVHESTVYDIMLGYTWGHV